jgi:hypothetical protein
MGPTIYVHGTTGDNSNDGLSWGTAVKTIQRGIDLACASDYTVIVADGIYSGTNNKNLDFSGKAVHLRSVSGPSSCIIDCENSGRGFYFHSGETATAIVEGFSVRNGNTAASAGAAILCDDWSDPTIINCILHDNYTERYGGGIACETASSPYIANCTIYNNVARHGGGISCGGHPTVVDCIIDNNTATTSWAAKGGGIYIEHGSCPNIINCIITRNTASSTSMASEGGGIGIFYNDCQPKIINCTIALNTVGGAAVGNGGGIYCRGSVTVELYNTIIWNNNCTDYGKEIYADSPEPTVILKSCDFANALGDIDVPGTYTTENCIFNNPLFINTGAGNFRLLSGSPCIDVGNNSLVPVGITTDLDGSPRIVDGIAPWDGPRVDIGAYEYQP